MTMPPPAHPGLPEPPGTPGYPAPYGPGGANGPAPYGPGGANGPVPGAPVMVRYPPAGYYPDGAVVFARPQEYATPGGRQLASATDRLLARIIDTLIISIPVLLVEIPLLVILGVWMYDTLNLGEPVDPVTGALPPPDGGEVLLVLAVAFAAFGAVVVLSTIVTYLYEVTFMHRSGQTIGKRLMKVRVVRVEDGGPIEPRHARRRWLAREGVAALALIPLVGSIVGVYNWLDSLWLLWDKPNRQCLHDKYGKTTVVKLTGADLAPRSNDPARAAA